MDGNHRDSVSGVGLHTTSDLCLSDRWRLGGVSPLFASPAVGVAGGGGASPVGLFPAGSRPPGSCQPAHLQCAAQPETGCPADPGGPAGPPTGTSHNTRLTPVAPSHVDKAVPDVLTFNP